MQNLKIEYEKENNSFIITTNNKISLTTLSNIFQNFDISIINSKTIYKNNIYTYQLATDIENINLFLQHKSIFLEIIQKAILNEIYIVCKLYYMAWEGLNLREIELLKSLIKYQKQLLYEFNENLITKTLIKYSHLTKLIIEYFINKFTNKPFEVSIIKEKINNIKNLNEDRIFRILFEIVKNIEKTNYFLNKETISFKVFTKNFKHLLFGIQPNIEIFVYHTDFNGIHLRMSKISRGGIRYSNREDFREEIKDLLITQEAKNAIIIPEGAKGGIVVYNNKDEFKKHYSLFIDAMLDLIEIKNISLDKDFYLVVAADKGTSNMSNVANEIAIKKGYFLKDAFASGGGTGYSHKELGITAKGAILSANRFFLEKNKNIYKDKISVVGIGSMRGDVFGNGMLLNKNFLLIAAISHNEIFIDPNPNPIVAYNERKRLFENSLSWSEYDKSKISKGGGVFYRNQKTITLTKEIKKLLNTKKETLTPDELIKKLLCLKVDLLYFGGIGTYIKSSAEENIHISDKENTNIRVDAKDIKAFCICEGANLALTMKGRFEYALKGGKVNLDAIDNSAGVNISDYEVNIKIVLNSLVEKNIIKEEEKLNILKEIQNEVIDKVLSNNFFQSLLLSLEEKRLNKEKLIKVIDLLESTDYFKRKYYSIPNNKEIEALSLIRPLIAIIMLYSKIFLKKYILNSDLLENSYFNKYLKEYFPKTFYKKFEKQLSPHFLKKEIIATQIANKIINFYGINFLSDFDKKTFKYKIISYLIIDEIININSLRKYILNNISNLKQQYELLIDIEETIEFALKWIVKENIDPFIFLNYKEELQKIIKKDNIFETYKKYKDTFKFLSAIFIIKYEHNYNLNTIFTIFNLIINKFKIKTILLQLQQIKPKTKLDTNLKEEIESLIKHFVITLARKFINSNEFNINNLEKSFKSYLLKNEYENIIKEIKKITNEKKSLTFLSHLANSLILQLFK